MRPAIIALACLLLTGCTTISTLSKMNRVLPQVEQLVYLQDQQDQYPLATGVKMDVCGDDENEGNHLLSLARIMGWKLAGSNGHCSTVTYGTK